MMVFENTIVTGWDAALRGMRNPRNSWDKSDSAFVYDGIDEKTGALQIHYEIGPNDLELAVNLVKAGTDHSKFMRYIQVTADITAPRYWAIQADTYRIGVEHNSTSTMNSIMKKPFSMDDFAADAIKKDGEAVMALNEIIEKLNNLRNFYLQCDAKIKPEVWKAVIQLLPQSYMQRRTWLFNYQNLRNMYHSRRSHKLSEWHEFCDWIETLPYAKELIVGEK